MLSKIRSLTEAATKIAHNNPFGNYAAIEAELKALLATLTKEETIALARQVSVAKCRSKAEAAREIGYEVFQTRSALQMIAH